MKKYINSTKYEDALEHVTRLREFYQQVFVYIIFVIVCLNFKNNIIVFVRTHTDNVDNNFLSWLNINIILVPVLWGIAILVYGLYLSKFKPSLLKKWEEKKLKKFMDEQTISGFH
ncbi:2TM domain-containing protein [Aureibaculum luteum]|uniref:2TM domain-containing protein n=1 Tax=Aureibaculum luteum TaxID=1548456 RepID=UPI0013007991|nr:2TM domain-containing protein [Aureibaculum luteum]